MKSVELVVFLDIDGVLNKISGIEHASLPLDRECVRQLNRVLSQSGARVVISSSWREHYELSEIAAILGRFGFEGEIVGRTPVIRGADRGEEIKTWLQIHSGPALAFVVIDDREDMSELREMQVRTTLETGLTRAGADRAIRILERERLVLEELEDEH